MFKDDVTGNSVKSCMCFGQVSQRIACGFDPLLLWKVRIHFYIAAENRGNYKDL